jgi:predicted Ser/Thr protein kinase
MAILLPEQFGRYRIVRRLGQGGMGAVYLAHDSQLDRRVALKVPHFNPGDGPEALERFYREARLAATLNHPHICPVYDSGSCNGIPYLTMAFIEGRPLSDLVGEGPLPSRQVVTLFRQVALALHAAHQIGVIHRDLKPANIMITPRGEAVVMDFGLARRATDNRLTQSGALVGTPAYMAPEQLNDPAAGTSPRSDIYSLGVVLYEVLAGRLPFEGPLAAVLGQIMSVEPPLPSAFRPHVDPDLEALCRRAMAKQPEQRPASMQELVDALDAVPAAGTVRKSAPVPCVSSAAIASQNVTRVPDWLAEMQGTMPPGGAVAKTLVLDRQPRSYRGLILVLLLLLGVVGGLAFYLARPVRDRLARHGPTVPATTGASALEAPALVTKVAVARGPVRIRDRQSGSWAKSKVDYAMAQDNLFEVGIGPKKDGYGSAWACFEIENIRRIKVQVDASLVFHHRDRNSFAGFFVDYHTPDGYSKRVALSAGMYDTTRVVLTPHVGKISLPDQYVDLKKQGEYNIDLTDWAPPNWDGTIWFSVVLQNTGTNTKMKGSIEPSAE